MAMPTLEDLIKESGMSLRELARKSGISITSFQGWRQGRVPTPRMRDKVEEFFGVDNIVFGDSDVQETNTPAAKTEEVESDQRDESPGLHTISRGEQFTLMHVIRRIGFDEALKRLIR
jgi:transcriptional regulator with XRE-family HTH domain